MTDEATFLQAILADPEDSTLRLAYADWLEERGDPRAEFLRVEAGLKERPLSRRRRTRLRLRLDELRLQLDRDWLILVDRTKIENCSFRFQYQCPQCWEALQQTDVTSVRFCTTCRKKVYYCRSVLEAQHCARNDRCVAVDSHLFRTRGDLAPPTPRYVLGALPLYRRNAD